MIELLDSAVEVAVLGAILLVTIAIVTSPLIVTAFLIWYAG